MTRFHDESQRKRGGCATSEAKHGPDSHVNFAVRGTRSPSVATDSARKRRPDTGSASSYTRSSDATSSTKRRPPRHPRRRRVSSAESNREDYFLGELSASPFGEEKAVRYEYVPGPHDYIVMDNDYAIVYVTGWQPEDGGLSVDYVAVNRCEKPLRLVLPEKQLLLDGRRMSAELSDSFGAYATLFGYIPVEGWEGEPPLELQLCLALEDPGAKKDALLEDTVTEIVLCR